MIPYFQLIKFEVGPVPINVWGLLVAAGILAGLMVAVKETKRRGLNVESLLDLTFWSVLMALIGARLFFVLTELGRYTDDPIGVFRIWEGGMSINGGFIGAVIAAIVFSKIRHLSFFEYAEVAVFGLPVGLMIGRLGCALIFDHPGKITNFFLGQNYSDGIARHNHGLYLSINGAIMALIFFTLHKQKPDRPTGFYTAFFLIWYGSVRIFLDFFRAYDIPGYTDARFFSLTGAQYVGVVMIVLGLGVWYRVTQKKTDYRPHATKKT
ncbi:MAG: prolipoprotein diacylglyceryl transferase [Candidatus Kerfeldbacteria bacterium CG15_BIG_FIL_POST_REV_8_21_14_020_45_12]|uniref:Phosphatidylglycerol--prolipoprotein diacylglyceryl transferase n=1 Tax=Candidatus Kerfeldbacteria bacterium CG15_BIG_FIL_POST_REV_8_21_14_020_45_12 TaxID=2014247 RepID=A0A2M7H470_9BACT|nr:MAG: prolipoprotein diacylglyceryl transferase [Candidatus Kerfeldbacteria bacterium CG15_BIG_FIL_POST_REV_8_21_14_020_45_12]PJA93567.1 MAG: prolipoprotein diacylglyceryl transferase [Candidatus Kerfeldbacteria bacterium CG_4_9_14_3_um_filter_45_8]